MKAGLYHPEEFKDNCGFGLIAHMQGEPSHHLLQTAIEALTCMTHRGGINADGKTGDGCGLLIQKPDMFLRAVAKEHFSVELPRQYCVGMVFLNQDDAKAQAARENMNREILAEGLTLIGWREVPIDTSVLGRLALERLPKIEQVFIGGEGLSDQEFAIKLFCARRRSSVSNAADTDHYICSFSHKTIIYKGLMMPRDLTAFYPDLNDERLQTAICVFHQRFSTNTLPKWPLAQPFRFLAHNGEINTITGNRNWAQARRTKFSNDLMDLDELGPLVNRVGSDSSSMDNMLELMVTGGIDLFRGVRMLVPPAWQNVETMDPDLRAFYEFNSMHMEPWDGPAGIVMTEGRHAVCLLDRNGLRPARWVTTKNGYITLASEIGVWNYTPQDVIAKGRVGPGQIFAVDTETGQILDTDAIDSRLKSRHPYKQWLRKNALRIQATLEDHDHGSAFYNPDQLKQYMKMFQVTFEERDQVLRPLGEQGQEAVGSMGDDTPMAVLSQYTRPLYDYFRQAFAQVTNPPIDPLRESCVMSLTTQLGKETNVFHAGPEAVNHVILNSPVLSQRKLRQLLKMPQYVDRNRLIDLSYSVEEGLKAGIERICRETEQAAREGVVMLLLSDRYPVADRPMVHALMATGAVHHHLSRLGLRCDVNLIIETGTARDPHHMACLLGFGATAVYPYLAYQTLFDLGRRGILVLKKGGEQSQIGRSYRKGVYKGLSKIISKMGICTIASYRGAQLFEIVGLDPEVVELCFPETASRIGGVDLARLDHEARDLAARAWNDLLKPEVGGLLKYVHGGEYHMYNPDVVLTLQRATRTGTGEDWQRYMDAVHSRPPSALRDLLQLKRADVPTPLDEVAPAEDVLRRFDTAAISLGALSPEAHEALAIAMNRLGGRSNSGEGGEDPARYGTEKRSKIKQVASGRFGVTPEYLVNAEVLQIKVAQGAKPGEGGQLPGHKVNELIARLRYAKPGIGLISPPPHHDIY